MRLFDNLFIKIFQYIADLRLFLDQEKLSEFEKLRLALGAIIIMSICLTSNCLTACYFLTRQLAFIGILVFVILNAIFIIYFVLSDRYILLLKSNVPKNKQMSNLILLYITISIIMLFIVF